jgi:serine-type D-Ala-D-Ala carboxypeptidase
MSDAPGFDVDRLPASVSARVRAAVEAAIPAVAPAVSLAVRRDGRSVLVGAFGRLGPGSDEPAAIPGTRFDLASLTKLVTAGLVLALASEGRLRPDDPLVRVLPEFGAPAPRPVDGGQEPLTYRFLPTPPERVGWTVDPASVTLRQLLAHASGLAPWRALFEVAGPVPPPPGEPDPVGAAARSRAAVAATCASAFVDRPGRAIRYSDLGFVLLGEVVARLRGAPLDAVVRERVAGPIELASLAYRPLEAGAAVADVAPTSLDAWRGRRLRGEVEDENAAGMGGVAAHAGLFATASDVARLGEAWLAGDPRLGIAPGLLREALSSQADEPAERRGLGWALRPVDPPPDHLLGPFGPRSFGHTGFTGTSLAVDPDRGLVVACLTNRVFASRTNPGAERLRRAIHEALLA